MEEFAEPRPRALFGTRESPWGKGGLFQKRQNALSGVVEYVDGWPYERMGWTDGRPATGALAQDGCQRCPTL